MILILSQQDDGSTVYVIQWLKYYGIDYIRIDRESLLDVVHIKIEPNGTLSLILHDVTRDVLIDFSKITAYWYRRGLIRIRRPRLDVIDDSRLRFHLECFVNAELSKIEELVHFYLSTKRRICSFERRDLNKLQVLRLAAKHGLRIPSTQIITNKVGIQQESMIAKSISDPFRYEMNNAIFSIYTEKVDFSLWPTRFFPTLVQEAIAKEADIRVFYLLGECYAMAIMSQTSIQTSTDFRKYLRGKGNRNIPFKLPFNVSDRLQRLMTEIGLESASIDLILTRDGEFVFLEVNPVGQYDMVSGPCNYYLHKKIAKHLVELSI